ncbi:hypothetical protein K435DRAFT_973435 [Dendrothele bispora CBS 962.96]|uniref:Nrap protein domain-containing protein n=1 Tax=Dendrothele bispora (strain CBS 962.96) TaxID=1314807 RepID=A0A4S8KSG3_DENBC|nr:hypothetical protein K435DRAFT_973435 [Dendrothele bispora CBS 962.96]
MTVRRILKHHFALRRGRRAHLNVKVPDDNELPTTLLNAHSISESLRHTSVFGPAPLTPALASSLPMNARIKFVFWERIGSALIATAPGLTASVIIGEGNREESDIQDSTRLGIVSPEGWVFLTRIWHDCEATLDLLDRILSGTGSLPCIITKSTEKKGKIHHDAVRVGKVYTRRFTHSPAYYGAITKLCHHFPGTVRIVRWFASYWLLHGHNGEAIEFLCAAFFVEDG